jgi:ABC-type glycerol-3-phosphate transport system substrate-binding protein
MRYRLMIGMLLCLLTIVPIFAQSDEIVISLAIQEYELSDYRENIIPQFEAENPGIRVHLDTTGGYSELYWNENTEWYLDRVAKLASQTDVFLVNQYLQRDATRAGYLLDLAPLVRTDMTINQANYYANTWESFTWDGGIWAIPSFLDTYVLMYDKDAFDVAGLPYPDQSWTVYDYVNAIRSLTTVNPDGTVDVLPIENSFSMSQDPLFLAFLNDGIYDDNGLQLDPSQIQPILDEWQALNDEGYFNVKPLDDGSSGMVIRASGSVPPSPITILSSTYASFFFGDEVNLGTSLLPNNYVPVDIKGYAVSSGTQYPEASYLLAKYLSNHPLLIANQYMGRAADMTVSLDEVESFYNPMSSLPADDLALIESSFNNIRPASEQHFFGYISQLFIQMGYANNDVSSDSEIYTLADVATKIEERLQLASERLNTPVMVNPPPQRVQLAPGEIELKFAVGSTMSPFPYKQQWDSFVSDYVANHPTIGNIALDTGFIQDLETMTSRYDCFYSPDSTILQNNANLSLLLSLDPFLSTDPNNVLQDFVEGVLEQSQINGQTLGFPLTIMPENMIYRPELFQQANAGDPTTSWTVSDFENALWALQGVMENNDPPFQPMLFTTQHLFLLIIAYGGIPFDFSTTPITFDFTDEATVNAVKQVLDLVRNNLMSYAELGNLSGSMSFSSSDSIPLRTETMSMGSVVMMSGEVGEEMEYQLPEVHLIPYPAGSQYAPVSFQVGSAYISASTPYAQECYELISEISQQPNLFIGQMPALSSVINSAELEMAHNTANTAFYRQYEAQLLQPNTFILPTMELAYYSSGLSEIMWVYRVFDDYVKNGDQVDLASALADAQVKMNEQIECVSHLPDLMTLQTDAEFDDYINGYEACIQQIDPSFTLR